MVAFAGLSLAVASYFVMRPDVGDNFPSIVLPGNPDTVWSVDFSIDGKQLAAAIEDGSVRIWHTNRGLASRLGKKVAFFVRRRGIELRTSVLGNVWQLVSTYASLGLHLLGRACLAATIFWCPLSAAADDSSTSNFFGLSRR